MLKLIYSIAELDLDQLLEIYKEWNLDSNNFTEYLREDFFQQKDAFYALWIADGHYKAALRMEPYNNGLLLEALCTGIEDRRKGYGYMLVNEVLKCLSKSEYKVVYSHINKKNKPSIKLHKKCNFQICLDSARLIDGTVTQNSCTMCYYL